MMKLEGKWTKFLRLFDRPRRESEKRRGKEGMFSKRGRETERREGKETFNLMLNFVFGISENININFEG